MSKVEHLHEDVYDVEIKIGDKNYTSTLSLSGAKRFIETAPENNKAAPIIKAMVQAIEDTQKPKNEVQRHEPKKELSGEVGESDDDKSGSETGAESETAFPGRKTKSKNR